jgi:hypothetical protein
MPTTSAPPFPTKTERDAYLFFPEQALVVSACCYRAALSGAALANCKISLGDRLIANDVIASTVDLEIKLATANTSWKAGGDFFKNIVSSVKTTVFPPAALPQPPSGSPPPMPLEPNWVNSIEKYIGWLASDLWKRSKAPESTDTELINILVSDATQPMLIIHASVPIDLNAYLQSGNLFQSVKPALAPPSSGGSGGGGGGSISLDPLDNAHFVSNSTYFGN